MSAAAKNFSPKNVQRGRKNRRQRTDASPLPRILPERPPRNGKKFCTQSAADGKFRKDLERRAACPGAETGRWMPYKPWSAARFPPPPAGADKTGRNILRGSIRKQSRKILTARRHLRRYRALHSKKECCSPLPCICRLAAILRCFAVLAEPLFSYVARALPFSFSWRFD